MSKTVLIVDDELDIQSSLAFALKDEGYEVLTATSPAEAEKKLAERPIDLTLYDVWFPEGDGLDLLKVTRQQYPRTTVIMMSGHGNIELALKAIRDGAYDFMEKPLELEKVLVTLRNASEAQTLREQNKILKAEVRSKSELIGVGRAMQNLRTQIERAANAQSHVIVYGENGSGKELVARQLHELSSRADKPYVAVNCAAIPESLFESELFGHEKGSFTGATQRQTGRIEMAGGGVLFLDEISELSLNSQAKLLRVLEERSFERVGGRTTLKVEARVVVATNKELSQLIKENKFREDLFFRLNVLAITVPPLRERDDDIGALVEHFLRKIAEENGRAVPRFDVELLKKLETYDWPGNVRELRNLIERMMIMSPEKSLFTVSDIPEELGLDFGLNPPPKLENFRDPSGTLRVLRAQFERTLLEQRIEKMGGSITKAAESLGIERAHLHRKLKAYGLSREGPNA